MWALIVHKAANGTQIPVFQRKVWHAIFYTSSLFKGRSFVPRKESEEGVGIDQISTEIEG